MNTKKFFAKIIVAVALTLAVFSSGIVGDEIGVSVGPSAGRVLVKGVVVAAAAKQ